MFNHKLRFLILLNLLIAFFYYVTSYLAVNSSVDKLSEPITFKKLLITYPYYPRNGSEDRYNKTLYQFFELGVTENDEVDYLFILQGMDIQVQFPSYKNVFVLRRNNTCYDFGAYGDGFKFLGGVDALANKYTHFMFINPSVVGPILPKYWPANLHWSEVFLSRLKGNVHAVGTTIECLDVIKYPPCNIYYYMLFCNEHIALHHLKPKDVESTAFAATYKAIKLAYDNKTIFNCKQTKPEAVEAERNFSLLLLDNGLNIDTLMLKYGNIDWRNKNNWICNRNELAMLENTYGNESLTLHPLEQVFYKPIWFFGNKKVSEAYYKETNAYMEWAIERKRLERDPNHNYSFI